MGDARAHFLEQRKLLPPELFREQAFYGRVRLLVRLLYSVPWLYLGFRAVHVLEDGPIWENWPSLWRAALAICFGWYHLNSNRHGLFYWLDIWQNSISTRLHEWEMQNPEKAALLRRLQPSG